MSHDEHGKGAARCREIFKRLSEYLDQELDSAICATVDEHMHDCVPCRAFLESLRRTVVVLNDAERTPLPDDLRRRVLDAYHALQDGLEDRAGD